LSVIATENELCLASILPEVGVKICGFAIIKAIFSLLSQDLITETHKNVTHKKSKMLEKKIYL